MTWRNLDSETRAHIEEKALDLIESGVPEAEAWERARREFGNATATVETSREQWGWVWLERIWQDLVYARRILFKDPGFTLIAVLSLALGVGANCAMFSFADVLLLRPLPVPNASELLNAGSESPGNTDEEWHMSYPDFADYSQRNQSFAELAAFEITNLRYAAQPDAPVELRMGVIASGNLFSALQVKPALGRAFVPSEDEVRGRDAVMMLSHAFWKQEFASDPAAIGRRARINSIDFTIVGVLAEGFTGPDRYVRPDFYVPMMMWSRVAGGSQDPLSQRDLRIIEVKGRLKPGISVSQARAEAAAIGKSLAAAYPATNKNFGLDLKTDLQVRLQQSGPVGLIIAMLLLLALFVLFVACANVAGLLSSKAPARAREMSLRLAIGAGRGRIVRQLMTESLILALLGAAGGAVVGYAGIRLMSQLTIVADAVVDLNFALDYRVLSFGLAAAVLSVFLFGLGPALRSARTDLTESLRTSGSQPAKSKQWVRNVLVVGQIALSMVLLTVASLMFQTFRRDLLAGPGFRSDNVLMAAFNPSLIDYDEAKTRDFYKTLPERARNLPGVRSVALASMVPANYNYETMPIAPEGFQLPDGDQTAAILTSRVDENYFNTLHVPLVRGRGFAATDVATSPLVAVANEAAASQFWPGQDPIGKRIRLGDGRWLQVVGVAKTGKYRFLMERPTWFLYVPYAQHPRPSMVLLLESGGDASSLAAPIRDVVREIDASMPVYGVRSLKRTFDANAVNPNLLIIRLEAAMGAMGVLLALSGLYGLIAYSVSVRRREIGIRMAVGAAKTDVLRMVMRQGVILAGVGSLIGLLFAIGAGRLLVAVFPATDNSVVTYLIVIPAVFAITILAALLPASRAVKVDPAIVLRQG